MAKYIRPRTVVPEPDAETGDKKIMVETTNIAWKAIVTAYNEHHIKRQKDLEANPSGTKIKEFEISRVIKDDIHEIWTTLNPS